MSIIEHKIGTHGNCRFVCRNACPYCNKIIFPEMRVYTIARDFSSINAIMLCPSCFTEYFEKFTKIYNFEYTTVEAYPYAKPQTTLPAGFSELFPDFYKIYLEAAQAESYNLLEICGMGYRKALEALVKQYAIELFPDEVQKIQKETLMQTIQRFASQKIITLATAATWLGNDHAHLVTKHPDYDLNALKSFINVLCQYIQSEKEIEKATDLINRAKK